MRITKLLFVGFLLLFASNGFSQQLTPDYNNIVGRWNIVRFDQIVFSNGLINQNNSPCTWFPGEIVFANNKTARLTLNNVTYHYTFKIAEDYIYFNELSTGKVIDYRFRLSNKKRIIIDHSEGLVDYEKGTTMFLERE